MEGPLDECMVENYKEPNLLRLSLVGSLVLMVYAGEVRDNDGHWQCDHQHTTQGAYTTNYFPLKQPSLSSCSETSGTITYHHSRRDEISVSQRRQRYNGVPKCRNITSSSRCGAFANEELVGTYQKAAGMEVNLVSGTFFSA